MAKEESFLERILDGKEKPADLPLELLERITNNFSEDRKIGQGGFGAVYKGVLGERSVAVKKIEKIDIDDKLFDREFNCLWVINHENVVRFLGFCSSTCKKPIEKAGVTILAEVRERLFCFEYISGGSLAKHITDELRGLEWEKRYEIIIGISKGLCYLHKKIDLIHMDLKPANILVDGKNMVPKITDFGLSRPNTNSHTMAQPIGTLGYIAPEYSKSSKTTTACDIYSLGAIIMELVTGGMEVPNKHNVLRRWRHRWNKPPTPLQYQQVIRCIEIAGRCREQKPEARPSIEKIIDLLSQNTDGPTDQEIRTYMDDDMLGIEPLELHFHKQMACSVKLTNKTKACFAFEIERPIKQYTIRPEKGILTPGCEDCIIQITMGTPQVTLNADKFIVRSTKVSEGLTVEHITEHIFHAEAGKMVDEVDLMVVYELAKTQGNFRGREGTSMSAEEVPEAKKRKNVESAFGKGKIKLGSSENAEATSMGIKSSMRGQCTMPTEQCCLHTLQCFSRNYPTNKKYLGKESDRAVNHARGAMGSLLDKLGKLVTGEYTLDLSIKKDIEYLSIEMTKIHLDFSELQNVVRAKVFVNEVRELSYNIEDMVDNFLVHVETDSSSSSFRELAPMGLKLLVNGMPTHHHIDDVITDIKDKVKAMMHRKEQYNFNVKDVVDHATSKATIEGLRISAIYEDKEQLVGINVPRDDLIRLLKEDDKEPKKKLRVVSIVGMGGLGKTTLAKAVYDKVKEYHPKAFVPVGQNAVVETVLKNIISEFDKDFNAKKLIVGQLIEKLKTLLKNKRYLLVIDDLWDSSAWGVIKSAFPRKRCASRVIITTRDHNVALACCHPESKYVYSIKPLSDQDSRKLLFRRIFGSRKDWPVTPREEQISKDILKKCSGMPLALNSIASLLAGKVESAWEYIWKSLNAMTEEDDLEIMKQILDLSYIHLPEHLKTCLLYVCTYPEDREIHKTDLLRQWVAEGFVSRKGHLDAEDVAESNFKALINMCMIEPGKIDYNNEVLSCRVHDIILDLMRSKSSELNFIHVVDGSKDVSGQIRRVSVQYNDKEENRIPKKIEGLLSHARSVFLCRRLLLPDFLKYKYVRVLHLEDRLLLHGPLDLTGISCLFLLRYLKIACRRLIGELKLPNKIGHLQQLEIIDLSGGTLETYPSDIITLPWLSHLQYSGWKGVMLPDGIERLKSLHTLNGVCVGDSSVESIKGLGELTSLRNLGIHMGCASVHDEVASAGWNALHFSISRLSTSLRILTLEGFFSPQGHDIGSWSRKLFSQGSPIRMLHLYQCSFERCPEWIGHLHYLYSLSLLMRKVADGFKILEGLPSLAILMLCSEEEPRQESIVISGVRAFQALKRLAFYCEMTLLTFEEGALPKLEKLEISLSHHTYRRILPAIGIEHLPAPTFKGIEVRFGRKEYDNEWLCMLEGSQNKDDCYYNENLRKRRLRKFRHLVESALKEHHPDADIEICECNDEYSDDEEEWCNDEDDDDEGADECQR